MLATPVFLGTLALLLPAFPPDSSRPAFDPGGKRRVALASGVTMAYLETGPKDGPPLILLHGLGDTGRSWSFVLPELAERHRVYVLDQRGHGETQAPACCYALADLVYDVVTFMDAMRIERAAVAGHSLGSFVAQHLAAAHPARVSRLVLLGSADTTVGNEVFDWLWGETRAFESKVSAAFRQGQGLFPASASSSRSSASRREESAARAAA